MNKWEIFSAFVANEAFSLESEHFGKVRLFFGRFRSFFST